MKRVVVGLSGGVDSSVAAHLLVEQGYEVIGIFMRNWHDESVLISDDCPWIEDSNDAMMVAETLGIPYQTLDLSEEYKKRIVDYMFAEYKAGRTPNPDVLCNREIKYDVFLKAALKLNADYVATGHYCRKDILETEDGPVYRLLAGKDANKDQSYFLCQLNQEQLSKALFPIGELEKSEVRAIAAKLDLVTAEKKDSQGLCFIGKVHLPDFLQQQLTPKKGSVIKIEADSPLYTHKHGSEVLEDLSKAQVYHPEDGNLVGEHIGAHYYTIGQRKGLNIGGFPEPLFIIGTDITDNTIYMGMGETHPGLFRSALFIPMEDIHWVREDLRMNSGDEREVDARIRYRQPLQKCRLVMKDDGMFVRFEEAQKAITPGQFVAWYDYDELLGSGVIS